MGGSVEGTTVRGALVVGCPWLLSLPVVAVALFGCYDEKGANWVLEKNIHRLKVLDLFSSVRTQNR